MKTSETRINSIEMIELPIFGSEETFMGKVAITNNGDYIRFSDIAKAIATNPIDMIYKLALFTSIKEKNKEKLTDDPEDETGFFIHLDSLSPTDGEIYDSLTVEKGEWFKENVVPRIFLKPEEEIPQHIKPEVPDALDDILASIDSRLNKIQKTLDFLLDDDYDEDDDDDTDDDSVCKCGFGVKQLTEEQFEKIKKFLESL